MKISWLGAVFAFLILASLGNSATAWGRTNDLPPDLEPWKGWVLYPEDPRPCYRLPDAASEAGTPLCAWPGRLHLETDAQRARFTQTWRVYTTSWVPLPGDPEYWPVQVAVDGTATPVVARDGLPYLRLDAGEIEITGEIPWSRLPNTLRIPPQTGLLALQIDGAPIAQPRRDTEDNVWLSNQTTADSTQLASHLDVKVYRLIHDGVPVTVTTHIMLDIAGPSRDETLGQPLLPQQTLMALNSALPAKLDAQGQLIVQARPGQWVIALESRADNNITSLTMPSPTPPWPNEEYWSFSADTQYRVVDIAGGVTVDPKQTSIPTEWNALPAYLVTPQTPLSWTERQRGMPINAIAQLHLQRDLWLDFSGDNFTLKDQIHGQVFRDTRLNSQAALQLAQAQINGDNQLITRDPNNQKQGLEIRSTALNLTALSRQERAQGLPVSGWENGFETVRTALHLPPGYTLLAAPGVDNAPEAWSNQWSLFDLFMLLIIISLTKQMLGWRWALLAGIGTGICFHEPGAPIGLWINALAATLAAKAIPQGRLQAWAKRYQWLALALLALIITPFVADQARLALHPQLENAGIQTHADNYGASIMPAAAPPAGAEMAMDAVESVADYAQQRNMPLEAKMAKSKKQDLQVFDPNAIVQAGPGIPNWQWNTFTLSWNGPVTADQTMQLVILSDMAHRLWRVLMIAFVLAFFATLIQSISPVFKWRALTKPGFAAACMLAGVLALGGAPKSAMANTVPSNEMLEELKRRLLAPESCYPSCVTLAKALITANDKRVTLELEAQAQASSVLALPGLRHEWQADTLSVDDNENPPLQYQGNTAYLALDPGIHRIVLSGLMPAQDKLTLTFPLKPHWISSQLEHIEIMGLQDNRLLADGIELIRTQRNDAPTVEDSPLQIPAFVRIHRYLDLQLEWSMRTVIERVAPQTGVITLTVPVLPGESIVTSGLSVRDGAVTLSIPSENTELEWQSVLKKDSPLKFTAHPDAAWTERWHLSASANWHIEHQGLPPIAWQAGESFTTQFAPWPGETLTITAQKPEAVPGSSLAVDNARLVTAVGQRNTTHTLEFRIRASRGLQHALGLPTDIDIKSFEMDGAAQPLPKPGQPVTLSLNPGEHNVKLHWLENHGIGTRFQSSAIDLKAPTANIAINLQTPGDRWLLWTQGPKLGPAVLYWGELLVLLLFALALSRYPGLPLRVHDWVLLGIGISLHAWPILLLVGGWFVLLDLRRRHASQLTPGGFNVAQVLLAISTFVALASLIAVIPQSLLGRPDMSVTGNQSYDGSLQWFVDRSEGLLPSVGVFSIPVFIYQFAMLAWSIWIAFSLIRWIKWAWLCYNTDGLWRARPARKTIPKNTQPATEGDSHETQT